MIWTVKSLPAMQETWVWSPGWEDPLEKGMAPHSSILAWRIPWTEEPGGLQSMGLQRVGHDWAPNAFTFMCSSDWVGTFRWPSGWWSAFQSRRFGVDPWWGNQDPHMPQGSWAHTPQLLIPRALESTWSTSREAHIPQQRFSTAKKKFF